MHRVLTAAFSLTPRHGQANRFTPYLLHPWACFLLVMLIIMGLCWPSAMAQATVKEEQRPFVQSNPQPFSYDETAYLAHTFYLSDQEIWFDFPQEGTNGELVRFDLQGTMMDTISYELLRMQGDDVSIECIQRVDDRLMIGYRDFATSYVEIVIFSNAHEELARTSITDAISGMVAPLLFDPMVPSQQGILFAGILEEKEGDDYTSQLYLTLIDGQGRHVFESLEAKQSDSEHYGINSSICSDEDYHYILSQSRAGMTQSAQERLICKNNQGETVWEVELPDTLSIRDIAASHGMLYLAGLTGDMDEYGNLLIDQKGILLCFDQLGNKRWEHVYPDIASYFWLSLPNAEECYAFASDYATDIMQTYIVSVYPDGVTERAGYLEASVTTPLYTRFFLTEDGSLMQAGKMITGEVDGVRVGSVYITTIE